MLEGLLGGKTLLGIIDEDTAEKVEELLIECCSRGNDLLQQIQLLHWSSTKKRPTGRLFIALTYFFEAFDVS